MKITFLTSWVSRKALNIRQCEPLLKNNPKCKCYFQKYSFIINSYILIIVIIIYLVNDFTPLQQKILNIYKKLEIYSQIVFYFEIFSNILKKTFAIN